WREQSFRGPQHARQSKAWLRYSKRRWRSKTASASRQSSKAPAFASEQLFQHSPRGWRFAECDLDPAPDVGPRVAGVPSAVISRTAPLQASLDPIVADGRP